MALPDLVTSLEAHRPADDEEAADLSRILAFVGAHDDPFDRRIEEGHLTGSAVVVAADGARVLLLRHRKLQRWLQPGGHADPGESSGEAVALREALEETGIHGLALDPRAPRPFDVDVHDIPARPGEPAHQHLDLRFLVVAPPEAALRRAAEESSDVRWFAWNELEGLGLDPGLQRAIAKARRLTQAPSGALLNREVPRMQGGAARDPFWRFERDGWQRAAEHYEASWSQLTRSFIPPLLRALGLGAGTRLLDVCCGPGYVAEAAHRAGASVLGIDFAAAMVRRARERVPEVEFREGDAQQLPLEPAGFDAVAMNFGVPHLADPEAAFAEARRVLRPGGRFAFTAWARPEVNPLARIMDEAIEAHADTSVDLPKGPPYFRFADRAECRETLAAAGFARDSLSFEAVTVKWRVPTPATLFEAERLGGVRTAAVLALQTPQRLEAIRAAVVERVGRFAREGGFAIPATAHVVSAAVPRRPTTRSGTGTLEPK